MPASSVGALNSWGVYLLAAAVLLTTLYPALSSGASDSREGLDLRNVEGVRAVLMALRPGVAVTFTFGPAEMADAITLSGHDVSSAYGGGVVTLSTPFGLPSVDLFPGVEYVASVEAGNVGVAPAG